MNSRTLSSSIALASFAMFASMVQAQTWTTITNRPPAGVTNCVLLTDGGVMCQAGTAWYKLAPNISGSYLSGTWSTLASFPSGYNPDAYASAILADGRAVVVGGEYNNGSFALTNMGAVYDPKANTWTMLTPPSNIQCIGDAPGLVLADGRFLVGSKLTQAVAVLDPLSLTWTAVTETGKTDTFNSEEGWTLLPDTSFFTLDVAAAPASERFTIAALATSGVWSSAGNTPSDLHTPTTSSPLQAPGCPLYNPPGEVGPTLLLPSGKVFAVGANGLTAVYTPPGTAGGPGSWVAGPSLPSGQNVEDGPGAVLPNGHALFGSSPGATGAGLHYYEFDGTSLITEPAPTRANSDATYYTSLLVLPSGQVMFVDGSTTVQLYSPTGLPDPSWAPAISSVPLTINNAATYQISGTQFNGLTQATAFGDESQNATNYPLVRITNTASQHVFYAKTHGHSSMGVATGSTLVSTNFDVPANVEAGPSTIQVVANGIGSAPVAITVVSTVPPTITSLSPNVGPTAGGTIVTIFGTNFVSGATVKFGGVAATAVTFNSATSLSATTPANPAGVASVVVTNPSGGAATLSNGFTFQGPAPTISSVSPASGTASGGTSVTIGGTNFVSGAKVTFGGTSASIATITATAINVTTPAHAAGVVSVLVTNADGQTATLANGFRFTAPAPAIRSVSPTSGTRSGGTSVTISGSNFVSGAIVTFGGTKASVQSLSSGTIRVRTPAHSAGTVSVVVTNPDTQLATVANGYTFR